MEMKLSFVLYSQIKLLEAWGSMEKQHSSAVSSSLDCLQSAVCRVPLIEGATLSHDYYIRKSQPYVGGDN
ncbi:hypothetical protein KY285_016914 [Solanum tuberosum]|nr:hypothetical protein KY285_016914 [Solanum tuberosum]